MIGAESHKAWFSIESDLEGFAKKSMKLCE